jgi:hypothetical protein
MSARRLAVVCGTVVLAGWVAGGLARFGSSGIDDTGAPTEDSRATSVNVDAEPVDAPQATTMDGHSRAHAAIVDAALPGPRPMLPPETPHVLVAVGRRPAPRHPVLLFARHAVKTVIMG